MVLTEFQLWVTKRKREVECGNKLSESLPQIIEQSDSDLFPNIYTSSQILTILPVNVVTVERSFSTLERLKTWLRDNSKEERLVSGLVLLNVYRDTTINVNDTIS